MIDESRAALAACVEAGVPVILWGPPGVGKSSAVRAVAAELGMHLETVIASIREPSDFAGLPMRVGGSVELAPPRWARNIVDHGGGIVFYDEISTAPPAVQAALLRPILEGVVGDLALP
ncbi:MAG: ATP-binding protein, partial [Actinomycetota bacterium]|nr:ATP-binding protein [Actinomycetota bacterium]